MFNVGKNTTNKKEPLFYAQKPLFGFDIGHGSIKVLQLHATKKGAVVSGNGSTTFDPSAIVDGEIINFEAVAEASKTLFDKFLIGSIRTNAVAASLPVNHTFNRVITLPVLEKKDLGEAVNLEAEQYIPIPVDQLYIDYQVVEGSKETNELLLSAAPKHVVNSYVKLFSLLGLDTVILEPSILSVARLVQFSEHADIPTLVADLGSTSTDLIVYDSTVRVTGTIKFGGNVMTEKIAKALNLNNKQAHIIKTKYGLDKSKKQQVIVDALQQPIDQLVTEIRKIIRYYEDRSSKKDGKDTKVGQIIILGGGANLPGLSAYLTSSLRVPTRLCDPWNKISFGDKLQPPHQTENTMYATVAGLALIKPKELLE